MPTSTSEKTASTSSAKSAGSSSPTSGEGASSQLTTAAPLLINMGKVKRKKAKKIKKGRGPVLRQVEKAVNFAADHLEEVGKDTVMVPVVILYERKPRRKKRWW